MSRPGFVVLGGLWLAITVAHFAMGGGVQDLPILGSALRGKLTGMLLLALILAIVTVWLVQRLRLFSLA